MEMLKKLSPLLKEHPLIVIERQENFSWLTQGRGHIGLASEIACGSLLVSEEEINLISNNIELKRLIEEEAAVCVTGHAFSWYDDGQKKDILAKLTAGRNFTSDTALSQAFKQARTTLDENEKSRYKTAGRLTGEAVEAVCYRLKAGMTEYEAAGEVAKELYSRGLDPVVTLIGSDERLDTFRHFLPTGKKIERKVIISVVGRFQGLMSSVTRTVYFEPPTEEETRKMAAVQYVDAKLIAAVKSGVAFSELFEKLKQWYKDTGFAGEWQNHHQGGLTGFLPREERVLGSSNFEIGNHQAFAFNPSVAGAKSEDTILITNNETEIITLTGNYPSVVINVNGESIVRPTFIEHIKWY